MKKHIILANCFLFLIYFIMAILTISLTIAGGGCILASYFCISIWLGCCITIGTYIILIGVFLLLLCYTTDKKKEEDKNGEETNND